MGVHGCRAYVNDYGSPTKFYAYVNAYNDVLNGLHQFAANSYVDGHPVKGWQRCWWRSDHTYNGARVLGKLNVKHSLFGGNWYPYDVSILVRQVFEQTRDVGALSLDITLKCPKSPAIPSSPGHPIPTPAKGPWVDNAFLKIMVGGGRNGLATNGSEPLTDDGPLSESFCSYEPF